MRRARALLTLGVLGAVFCACSALTSFGDLIGTADASRDANVDEGPADGADGATLKDATPADAADAGPSLLSCNASGLVAYWPMNEGTGATVHDCVQGIDGMFSASGVTWGARGDAGDLEFTSFGNVSFGLPAQIQLPGPFTLAAWVRSDAKPSAYASAFWNYSGEPNGGGYEITFSSDGTFYAQVATSTSDSLLQLFPKTVLGQWRHVAAVYDPGNRFELYVNGVSTSLRSVDGGTPLPNVPPNTNALVFGALANGTWAGGLSDVRLFSRVLSVDEIATLAAN